jgi:hypothetical protein
MRLPNTTKQPWKNIDRIIIGFIHIISGIITILSLGFYVRHFSVDYAKWKLKKYIKHRRLEEAKDDLREDIV